MLADAVKNDPRLAFDEATHTYRLGDQPLVSVTQVLGLAGLADFDAPWFSEAVQARGSYLHQAIAFDVEGDLDDTTLDDELAGGVAGWRAFVRDTQAVIEHAERALCDAEQGVAGRLDYVLRLVERGRERRMLVDVKRGLYPCAAIQTAAYAELAAPLYAEPVVFSRAALVLPGDGSYRLHPFTDPSDRFVWHAALRVVHWRKSHGLC